MGIAGIFLDRGPNIFENANGAKTFAWEPLQDMAREQLGHQRINQRVAVQSSQSAFPVAAAAKRETRVPQVTPRDGVSRGSKACTRSKSASATVLPPSREAAKASAGCSGLCLGGSEGNAGEATPRGPQTIPIFRTQNQGTRSSLMKTTSARQKALAKLKRADRNVLDASQC